MNASRWLPLLRCPETGQALVESVDGLRTVDGARTYAVSSAGIPLFAESGLDADALAQQKHYDRIAGAYLANLGYPHTQEYMAYLDQGFRALAPSGGLGVLAEICCGAGEGFDLLHGCYDAGIGVDVSGVMLEAARRHHPADNLLFVQGDAVKLPLANQSVDSVVMLGGIHHVNNRAGLFREIARILKPGGRFLWREPVDDFFLWRWLRVAIYRLSPTLDADTEHPIRKGPTLSELRRAGMMVDRWKTFGFFGYCFLMNSDVLVVTRALRFIPGIRVMTRAACRVDELTLGIPGLGDAGLVAMGVSRKGSAA